MPRRSGGVPLAGGRLLGHAATIVGTPGSGNIQTGSIYLIKHDPARSIRRGRQLFQRKFSSAEGQGPRVNNSSTGDVTQTRALGAGLMDSCAGCHGRPRGSAGHGGVVQTFADSRDSPHLFGLGLIEQLADEMTADMPSREGSSLVSASGRRRRGIPRKGSLRPPVEVLLLPPAS